MAQTFSDILRERAEDGKRLFACAVWMFVETCAGIIRENMASIMARNRNIVRIALATASILLVPLVAMQFTDEVVWSLTDFIIAGALLFGTGLAYELVARQARSIVYRLAAGVALGTALFLVWANLAVGLIGTEREPANLMYLGVLAVGFIGACIARLRARGMSRALLATALAQASVAVIALIAGMDQYPESSVSQILGVNAFFAGLFSLSALLFQRASAVAPTDPR